MDQHRPYRPRSGGPRRVRSKPPAGPWRHPGTPDSPAHRAVSPEPQTAGSTGESWTAPRPVRAASVERAGPRSLLTAWPFSAANSKPAMPLSRPKAARACPSRLPRRAPTPAMAQKAAASGADEPLSLLPLLRPVSECRGRKYREVFARCIPTGPVCRHLKHLTHRLPGRRKPGPMARTWVGQVKGFLLRLQRQTGAARLQPHPAVRRQAV